MEIARRHKAGQQKIGFGQGSFADGAGLMPQGGLAKKSVSAKGRLKMKLWVDATRRASKKSVSTKGRLKMELGRCHKAGHPNIGVGHGTFEGWGWVDATRRASKKIGFGQGSFEDGAGLKKAQGGPAKKNRFRPRVL